MTIECYEGVKCPYCGKMHFDDLYRIDNGCRNWFECERCHEEFEAWVQIETKYYSEKVE